MVDERLVQRLVAVIEGELLGDRSSKPVLSLVGGTDVVVPFPARPASAEPKRDLPRKRGEVA